MSRAIPAWILAVATLAMIPTAAGAADFGIVPGSVTVDTLDPEGNLDHRAGAHPDVLRIGFGLNVDGTGTSPKNMVFELSPGFGTNPDAVPKCPRAAFSELDENNCPAETQVGILNQEFRDELQEFPLYNVEPAPGEAATLAAKPLWKIPMTPTLRPGDYAIILTANDLIQFPFGSGSIELWGIPADHQEGTDLPRKPFLATPTRCGSLNLTFRVRSWKVGAPWLSETGTGTALEDCESLPFEPEMTMELTNSASDSPTGVDIEFSMPRSEGPDERVFSHIQNAQVKLPEGIGMSPAGTVGRQACTDSQFGLGTAEAAACPATSRVGTIELSSPLLSKSLVGELFIGSERPGARFRLLAEASGPGATIKLVSTLQADPLTGRLTATFTDLPQVAISRLTMKLDGGSRALLATDLTCGQSTAAGKFDPYSGGASAETSMPVEIGQGSACPRATPFTPHFTAGSTSRRAGGSTGFSMTLRREDGEQNPRRFAVTLPAGMSGAFGRVPRCPDISASAGTCPAGSRVGTAVAELGSGPNPAAIDGDVYLTDSHRHAPFGLMIAFRAAIGPFDLGTIVSRAAVRMDRSTGQVTIRTDPLPAIVEGLPIRFRTIGIDLDRPGLLRNPTSCARTSIGATIQATDGRLGAVESPFALRGCNGLDFRPRFAMALTGRSQLRRHGRPALSIFARTRPGDTNIRAMRLPLPRLLELEVSRLREICSRRDATDGLCPRRARVGTAYARTPLLPRPLRGPISVVQPNGDGLPDLWLNLRAMGVEVDVRAEMVKRKGRIVTKMVGLPDMPFSAIKMRLPQGRRGVFSLRRGLCVRDKQRRLVVPVAARGQDGAFRKTHLRIKAKPRCRVRSAAR